MNIISGIFLMLSIAFLCGSVYYLLKVVTDLNAQVSKLELSNLSVPDVKSARTQNGGTHGT